MLIPAEKFEKASEPKADEITVLQAFHAMRIFLEAVWQRQGKMRKILPFCLEGPSGQTDRPLIRPFGKTG
jgi:hypothetical protein